MWVRQQHTSVWRQGPLVSWLGHCCTVQGRSTQTGKSLVHMGKHQLKKKKAQHNYDWLRRLTSNTRTSGMCQVTCKPSTYEISRFAQYNTLSNYCLYILPTSPLIFRRLNCSPTALPLSSLALRPMEDPGLLQDQSISILSCFSPASTNHFLQIIFHVL